MMITIHGEPRHPQQTDFFQGILPEASMFFQNSWETDPYAPCMVYLPTFGSFMGQMLVNVPYMEHMGDMVTWW
jgi:hypothetical protein